MSAPGELERACRLCLGRPSRARLLHVFEEGAELADRIRACVDVQVRRDDSLPQRVCLQCHHNVNNWHLFKQVCERSQAKLETFRKDPGQLDHVVKIKTEPVEEAYDDGVVIDGSYPDFDQNASSSKIQPEGPPILASLGLAPRGEKKIVDPRLDWPRVEAILNIVQDDEVIDALQSAEEVDSIQYSDHESESEGELIDIEDVFLENKEGYLTRDRQVLRRMPKSTSTNYKTKLCLPLKKSIPIEPLHCPLPKHAWRVFFTEEMMALIEESTNENILLTTQDSNQCTNISELEALIGILYLHGVSRAFYNKRADIWDETVGMTAIGMAMSKDRFIFLLENMRFEKEINGKEENFDVLKPIRKIFEWFAFNCRTSFEVSSLVVVDEKIEVVYGPCPFRTNLEKKPVQCGIKFLVLVDPLTFYVSNLDVHTDKSYTSSEDIVKKLVNHLAGSGKTLIMDSWFTSINLIKTLLKNFQLYTTAALKPSDKMIPPFFQSQHRTEKSYMTAFVDADVSLTSFVTSNRKVINILSSHSKYYRRSSVDNKSSVSEYKKNQSAGQVLDVLTKYYTTSQNTNSWTLSIFFALLDIASINAQVLWLNGRGQVVQRNIFIRNMALGLINSHLKRSTHDMASSNFSKCATHSGIPHYMAEDNVRYRCKYCRDFKRDRKTHQLCRNCGHAICREHTYLICTSCGVKYVEKSMI